MAREHILKCLEASRMAPSACNSQPWKFVVVDDRTKLIQMSDAAIGLGMNKFTVQVPVLVYLFYFFQFLYFLAHGKLWCNRFSVKGKKLATIVVLLLNFA